MPQPIRLASTTASREANPRGPRGVSDEPAAGRVGGCLEPAVEAELAQDVLAWFRMVAGLTWSFSAMARVLAPPAINRRIVSSRGVRSEGGWPSSDEGRIWARRSRTSVSTSCAVVTSRKR